MSRGLDPAPRARCLAVWVVATLAAAALTRGFLPDLAAARAALASGRAAELPFDLVLAWCCSAAALVCTAWLWVLTTLVAAGAARGAGHRSPRGVPAPLRRVVLAACGVAIAGGVAGPALAVPNQSHQGGSPGVVSGLPLPERASVTTWRAGGPAPAPGRSVVVRAGDSLWSLAEADLSPGAGDVRIVARWHQIYAQNRAVIGSDPDLIRPRQQLRLPRR